jgi:hypothetical protein
MQEPDPMTKSAQTTNGLAKLPNVWLWGNNDPADRPFVTHCNFAPTDYFPKSFRYGVLIVSKEISVQRTAAMTQAFPSAIIPVDL